MRLQKQLQNIDTDYRTATAAISASPTAPAAVAAADSLKMTERMEKTTERIPVEAGLGVQSVVGLGVVEQDVLKGELEYLEVARSVVVAHLHRLEQQQTVSSCVLGLGAASESIEPPRNQPKNTSQDISLQRDINHNNHNQSHSFNHSFNYNNDDHNHNNHNDNDNHNHHIDHSNNAVMTNLPADLAADDGGLMREARAALLHISAVLLAHLSLHHRRGESDSDRKGGLPTLLAKAVETFASQRRGQQQVTPLNTYII